MEDPTISPDGSTVAFVYQNNIWIVPFDGGVARRLTSTDTNMSRPSFSPCGKWIIYHSDFSGRRNLYRMPSHGGKADLVSNNEFIFLDWYDDGKSILVSNMLAPGQTILSKYEIEGKRPVALVDFRGSNATISPDSRFVAFDKRGFRYRPAYTGSFSGELWLYDLRTQNFRLLSDTPYTDRHPLFSKVVKNRVYFVSSNSNRFQLAFIDDFDYTTKTWLTDFDDWNVGRMAIARENDRIVFEKFHQIWRYDPIKNVCEKIHIQIFEDNVPYPIERLSLDGHITSGAVSKSGDLLVFSHKYDLFATPLSQTDVRQITFDQKGVSDICIMDDNENIYFISRIKGIPQLFHVNIKKPTQINHVSWSEGKIIDKLIKGIHGQVMIIYAEGEERYLCAIIDKNHDITPILSDENLADRPILTKDGKRIIYATVDPMLRHNILKVKDLQTNTVSEVFFSTNAIYGLYLDPTETYLFLNDGASLDIVRLAFDKSEKTNPWDKVLGITTPIESATPAWDISLQTFNHRKRNLATSAYPIFATTDSTLFFYSNSKIKSIKFDGSNLEDVFNFRHSATIIHYSDDKSTLYYIQREKLHRLNLKTKRSEAINFKYDYVIDHSRLPTELFEHTWGIYKYSFYDYEMHGLDWDEIYDRFIPFVRQIYNLADLKKITDEMMGLLNASHTGLTINLENRISPAPRAHLGVVFDNTQILDRGIRLQQVYHDSELSSKHNIRAGDTIMEIDGTPITAYTSVDFLLRRKVGQDINLKIRTSSGVRNVKVKGLVWGDHAQLQYEDMVRNNHIKVTQASGSRIGYLHIQRMYQENLARFREDFLAKNFRTDAMIIDVRSNGGGRISHDLFDIIDRTHRAFSTSRPFTPGLMPIPAHVYAKPLVCLVDEDSFSNAEIFATLFRDLNVGLVIGMPSSGGVIGTNNVTLMDGSTLRLPWAGRFRYNMENMEGPGAQPDIVVPRLPHHIVNGEDPQLDRAIAELLKLIN
jgi:C-terminal processing protease CtpA/Prc/Tol biopolymer transport system component